MVWLEGGKGASRQDPLVIVGPVFGHVELGAGCEGGGKAGLGQDDGVVRGGFQQLPGGGLGVQGGGGGKNSPAVATLLAAARQAAMIQERRFARTLPSVGSARDDKRFRAAA